MIHFVSLKYVQWSVKYFANTQSSTQNVLVLAELSCSNSTLPHIFLLYYELKRKYIFLN